MAENANAAYRVTALFMKVLYADEEAAVMPPPDAETVHGIAHRFAFHPGRLREARAEVVALIDEIVPDAFLQGRGGWSFLKLCIDRNGELWTGLHLVMEQLLVMGIALDLAGYCLPRDLWQAFPGGMPYVWFRSEARAPASQWPLIPQEHVERVCRPGQPGCCAYLASVRLPEYFCAKVVPDLALTIVRRLAAGDINATGDNCAGPPTYRERPAEEVAHGE